MEELNFQQKIAIMRILFDIVNADGRIDARETFYFNKVADILSMSEEDRTCVNEANSLLCLLEIKNFSTEQKKRVAETMAKMVVVDQDINVNEMAIYDLVCDTCDIDVKFEDIISQEQMDNSTRS